MVGVLYVVATPIGNLEDISHRAINTLKSVDLIAAEDTRHSSKLLQQFNILTKVTSYHEHNEIEKTKTLIRKLEQGENVAIITDAGTPLISDPGYQVVHEASLKNIRIVPIPGCCAFIAALSVSGLPCNEFIFEGFLPSKSLARTERLNQLKKENRTMIFYESPRRLISTVQSMIEIFGCDRLSVLGREITKIFETVYRGGLKDLLDFLEKDENQQKGECIIIIKGANADYNQIDDDAFNVLKLLLKELSTKKAVELASKITGKRKNILYDYALDYKK